MHLGRVLGAEACCDGPVSTKARHWLLAHLQGDDTGGNISAKNRDYNELTGTYWAWNNYASIGNPDYIGIFQYDRILMLHRAASEKFEEAIKDWRAYYRHVHSGLVGIMNGQDERGDLYAPIPRSFGMPMDEYWRQQVGHDNVDKLSEIIRRMRPEYVSAFEESCRSSTEVCSTLIYCRREVFFEYCRFLFPLLEAHEKECTPMPRLHALLGGCSRQFLCVNRNFMPGGELFESLKVLFVTRNVRDVMYASSRRLLFRTYSCRWDTSLRASFVHKRENSGIVSSHGARQSTPLAVASITWKQLPAVRMMLPAPCSERFNVMSFMHMCHRVPDVFLHS